MKLGYELTIEQTQKLVMTPELIQAIQILQFNTQELDHFVQEQLLTNPVLEKVERTESVEPQEPTEPNEPVEKEPEYDWAEHFKEREYDDISYQQWTSPKEPNDYTFEQFVSSDVTLTEHLLLQLQLANMRPACKQVARYLIEALDENGYLTSTVDEVAKVFGIKESRVIEIGRAHV